MEVVAHHLQVQAITRPDDHEKDLFGRSSYNRYYYSAFLIVRKMASELDPDHWTHLPHGDYPGLLKGKISKAFMKAREKASKCGDTELVSICFQAKRAAEDLSRIMEQGYATRVTADYHPEVPVEFQSSGRFKLNSIEITVAHEWPSRARILVTIISSAWKQIHD